MTMFNGRRVGTLSSGVIMVAFGLIFLLRIFIPAIDLKLILSLWPLILIFFGIEMIVSYFINKQEKMKYDAGAIALITVFSVFAMCMAGAEFIINNCHYIRY